MAGHAAWGGFRRVLDGGLILRGGDGRSLFDMDVQAAYQQAFHSLVPTASDPQAPAALGPYWNPPALALLLRL